jgi:hypothetical protein
MIRGHSPTGLDEDTPNGERCRRGVTHEPKGEKKTRHTRRDRGHDDDGQTDA